jgi:acyl dehydratase
MAFARQYDSQPFHVDERAAAKSVFGELIASGWHTAAIMCRLAVRDLFIDVAAGGGLGVEELRWPTPVKPGDTLSGEFEWPIRARPSLAPTGGTSISR